MLRGAFAFPFVVKHRARRNRTVVAVKLGLDCTSIATLNHEGNPIIQFRLDSGMPIAASYRRPVKTLITYASFVFPLPLTRDLFLR